MVCLITVTFLSVALASASEIGINIDGSQQILEHSSLQRARMLTVPIAEDIQNAEYEHATFWDDNGPLLHDAWMEWEHSSLQMPPNEHEIMNPILSNAIDNTFASPTSENEATIKELWTRTFVDDGKTKLLPEGVYATQLLTPSGIELIRSLLDQAAASGIPKRRPNGMNRYVYVLLNST